MMGWCKGLPEATEFSLFPPASQVRAWAADKERTKARLRVFPDLTFAITDIALDASPVVIPILGEAGEGGRGMYASPPSERRLREIEIRLQAVCLEHSDESEPSDRGSSGKTGARGQRF